MIAKMYSLHHHIMIHLLKEHIRPGVQSEDTWIYPDTSKLLQRTGLKPIGTYIYESKNGLREATTASSEM